MQWRAWRVVAGPTKQEVPGHERARKVSKPRNRRRDHTNSFGGKVRARSEGMARRQASAPVPQRLRWRERAWGGDSSAALAGWGGEGREFLAEGMESSTI